MSNYKKAVLALILANIIWGAGPPIFKWSIQNISPLTLVFFRCLIPVIILSPFISQHVQKIKIRHIFLFISLGILNVTLNLGLYLIGLQYSASINQPIIASTGPILILICSAIFLKDRATKRVLWGNIVGISGILFIVLEPLFLSHESSSFLGNMLFLFSTIAATLGTIVSKKLAKEYNAYTLVFWTFLIAGITLLPVPIVEIAHHTFLLHLSWQGISGILFGGIFSSSIGYGLFYYGLKYIKASETTIFTYVDPVAALLIAAPLLHEFPTPLYIIGAFLIFSGIYIAENRLHWHPIQKLF